MKFDTMTLLKAPFPIDSLSWRVGNKSNWDKVAKKPKDPNKPVKAQMLVYIDARDVQDRLDEVCGMNWSNDFKEVNGRLVCNLTINGVTRADGAGDTDFEGEKGGLSDALKRSAVLFGIGRYLYNAKNFPTWIEYKEGDTDFTMPQKAKEMFKDVARQLGITVQTYEYFLGLIKSVDNSDDFEEALSMARKYAKREEWNQGNMKTFLENVEKKRKELNNETA